MRIITGFEELSSQEKCAVAIGKFDGIHIGHRKLLERIFAQKEKGLISCVFTFDPAPEVFFGLSDGRELTTREEKRRIFEQLGVELLVEFPMTAETAGTLPGDFVREILCKCLHCRYVVAGTDLSFGRGGKGDEQLLRAMAPELGYEVETIDKVCLEGQEVSSSYIRSLVKEGRMEECERFLGRPYSICGQVIHGNGLGNTMGIPTANLAVGADKLMPPNGVYFSEVRISGSRQQEQAGDRSTETAMRAISNIGVKPTIPGENPLGVETTLFDYNGDLYERNLEISFLHYHRPERQFVHVEALKEQISKDIRDCGDFYVRKM